MNFRDVKGFFLYRHYISVINMENNFFLIARIYYNINAKYYQYIILIKFFPILCEKRV